MGDMSREPSMEDILSSIRRVIARDDAPGVARDDRAADDVLDLQDEQPATPPTADSPDETQPGDDELVSAASADAARQSLEALTAAIAPTPAASAPAPTVPGGRTIEDVVVDALRPMLKEWLDANLPAMVETMVAKEIGRITGRQS
jgi:cell pole-organizing protein PopZ